MERQFEGGLQTTLRIGPIARSLHIIWDVVVQGVGVIGAYGTQGTTGLTCREGPSRLAGTSAQGVWRTPGDTKPGSGSFSWVGGEGGSLRNADITTLIYLTPISSVRQAFCLAIFA